ncbi:MAG: 2-C-methyl-D-erythritol 4-phosphate cytidylyltransferase [Rothia sp. (in: high G+C Gram-positive bacteria)]|nr:2-C-methyl-D-erythritol 4-phosphate cytidylyltransferase [Rothia sp. (in: high G+C Gram-positive bacteria)]MDO5750583.1 2-C-methyl-D-erythritol 4-phosphate cytidylyltransferase [Rothia sp. (in: high G+C Gram-positive bacteria)]
MDPQRTAIIVLGAGSGTRLGEPIPKAAVTVGERTLLYRALQGASESAVADHLVVTIPENAASVCPQLLEDAASFNALVTAGGDSRTASVVAALDALKNSGAQIDHVLIHDCARSFTPAAVYERVARALAAGALAVIPVLPVVDTIKTVNSSGEVTGTPARSEMRAVQTPQGFELESLLAAHEHSRTLPAAEAEKITDDAMAMESAGHRVLTVAGDADAFKVTTPMDLRIARALYI